LQNERLRLARRRRFGETGNTVSLAAIPRRPASRSC
jgi:hypothetical protein